MFPLTHANQNLLTQKEPQHQKPRFRRSPQANIQESTNRSFIAKTAVAIISSLSASYFIYQNLPSKVPVAPPPSTIPPIVWVIGTLTASALLFMSTRNKSLVDSGIKKNDDPCLTQKPIEWNKKDKPIPNNDTSQIPPHREVNNGDSAPTTANASLAQQQSGLNNDKTPQLSDSHKIRTEIYKPIKIRFNEKKEISVDDFNKINEIIKYLETSNPSQADSDLAFSLSFFIRRLIHRAEPKHYEMIANLILTSFDAFWKINKTYTLTIAEMYAKVHSEPKKSILAHACEEINGKIICSNDKQLQSQLATFYVKEENPTLFRHIIDSAWNHFQMDPKLASEFLITCANLNAELCQEYVQNFAHLNWGEENNAAIALACAADISLQGNKTLAFSACENHLNKKQYDQFLPIAVKIIESFKKAKNIDDNLLLCQEIIHLYLNSEKEGVKKEAHRMIKILLGVSIISKDLQSKDLILTKFNLIDFDLIDMHNKYQSLQENDQPLEYINQISL